MNQPTAPTSLAIRVITAIVFVITIVCFVDAFRHRLLSIAFVILLAAILFCYLTAPTGYELVDRRLTVFTRVGSRSFEPVVSCEPATLKPFRGLRLFGNGGLFAGTGFYWNRAYGVYRAYVTSSRRDDLVLVRTATQRVLISPQDPAAFMLACNGPAAA